jgi:hypothetical protein
MNKLLVWVVVLLIVIGGGWYWFSSAQKQGGGGAGSMAVLDDSLYPLYSGVTWSAPEATTSPDYGQVVRVQASAAQNTMNIASATTPFEQYYHDKLTAAGWSQDLMREASGPGAEVSVYTKGDQIVVVMFSSVFHVRQPDAPVQCPCDVTLTLMSGTQQGPTPAQQLDARTYRDTALGFSIVLPTALASSTSDSLWSVDPAYQYQAMGPGKEIAGVKFTIPSSLASGTNLASDTYVSVEHLAAGKKCDAAVFLSDPRAKSRVVKEGALTYSVASSTDAAVGNRYEETVYARQDSNPCIAVRYYVHYAAIENFPDGAVKAFDKAALLDTFDQIRRSLRLGQ